MKKKKRKEKQIINKVRKIFSKNISEKEAKIKREKKPAGEKAGKIKIKKKERISTGIPGFDKLIEGGFEKESVNLIVGGSGSGKTILSMQFLVEGIKKGEKGLYITFEEKREEFYSNMLKFGWDLMKYEKQGKFFFLEYSPEKVKMMLEEGGGTIESVVLNNKIQRIVIDSVTSFSMLFDDELSKRQAALALFDIIRKWDCTSLLTLQENPSRRNENVSSMEFEADSIILLHYIRVGKERRRFIEILKMRGTDHSTGLFSLEIGKGVKIGSRAVLQNILEKF